VFLVGIAPGAAEAGAARVADETGIAVTVTASPGPVPWGANVTFTIVTVNSGTTSFGFVQLNNLVPGAMISSSSTAKRPCAPLNGSYLSCPLGPMPVGASATVTVTVTPAGDGDLTYTAWTTSSNPASTTPRVASHADVLPANDVGPVNTVVGIGGWGQARPFGTVTKFPVVWSAIDPTTDRPDIASYNVRVREAAAGHSLGPFRAFVTDASALTWSADFSGRPGYTYCFSMSATSVSGQVAKWGAETCTSTPVKAPLMRLAPGCVSTPSRIAYLGHRVSCRGGRATASLRIRAARRVAVVFESCPSCGVAVVLWDGRPVRRVALSRSEVGPVVVPIHLPVPANGVIAVRAATARRPIFLDGIDLSAV
jgi:hypothetical protein